MQRARILRAVELIPLLADAGYGVPHPAQVPDRLKDRHEPIIREVGDGELGAVVAVERRGELEGVEGVGQRSMLRCLSESAGCFAVLLLQPRWGTREDSLASLEGSQSGKEREGEGGKRVLFFSFRLLRSSKTRTEKK